MDGNAGRITRSTSGHAARRPMRPVVPDSATASTPASSSASASSASVPIPPGTGASHGSDAQQSLLEVIAASRAMRYEGRQGSVDHAAYQRSGMFYHGHAGRSPHMDYDGDADGDGDSDADADDYVEPARGESSMAVASAAVAHGASASSPVPVSAARRLFHQFRDPVPHSSDRSDSADSMDHRSLSHEAESGSEGESEAEPEPEPEYQSEPESESESESDNSLEASYLARRIAMTHQRNTLSPSASFPASMTNSANQTRRYLNMRDATHHEPDGEYADDQDHIENQNFAAMGDPEDPVEDAEYVEQDPEEEIEVEDDQDHDAPLDLAALGLKEISNLGRFTVNSHKPGNGVEELRSDDLKLYWQSDGPQPHKLTVYFIKRVAIRAIRFYVNHEEDESYTPIKIVFKSGTGENSLIEFASVELEAPRGWQDVPIFGCGGGLDGNTLVSYVFQMVILENQQNGKDTHLRGIKIYAQEHEERALGGDNLPSIDLDQSDIGLAPLGGRMAMGAPYGGGLARFTNAQDGNGDEDDEDEEEVARRKKLAQDSLLEEWISDSLLRGPTSVASMALR